MVEVGADRPESSIPQGATRNRIVSCRDKRTLRVNGQETTQEAIRVTANDVLKAWPGVDDLAADLADTVLALLDLLEAYEDLVEHLTAGESDAG